MPFKMGKLGLIISLQLLLIASSTFASPAAAPTKGKHAPAAQPVRTYRSLPSVSNDHYQELAPDGTYRYAYTGTNSYHAEKRLADGSVEGETLIVRPDGVPVKVHYFADNFGYRPQTEVLYNERIVSEPQAQRRARVLLAKQDILGVDVNAEVVHRAEPRVLLAPPEPELPPPPPRVVHTKEVHHVPVPVPVGPPPPPRSDGISVRVDGSHISIGDNGRSDFLHSGNIAAASPSITAIVGPGGHADIRPDTVARSGAGGRALSAPTINAVIGAGGSAVVAPSSRAYNDDDGVRVLVPPPPGPQHLPPHQVVATRTSRLYEPPPPPPPPRATVVHHVHRPPPPPAPEVHHVVHTHAAPPPPPPPAVFVSPGHAQIRGVVPPAAVVVPPQSKYSYTYSYNAPDPKHPHRDNSAFVAVNVNH